jgi:hypothetical protein
MVSELKGEKSERLWLAQGAMALHQPLSWAKKTTL